MIPRDFIDELLAKTDIVDIIDQVVPLKKSGANYMACCPFHKEKSPSFSVSPSKQFYHCFGCGVHGSAIGFVMEHQGMSFTEAVQYLADRVGMIVPRIKGMQPENPAEKARRKQQQQTLENAVAQAATFYQQQFSSHPQVMNYARQRGLSPEIIERYGIGYAPEGWTPLAQIFQPYPTNELINSGMVIDNEGKQYDRFRHRLMFPIRNPAGQVIGFGGRVLDDSKPKYLNSPDTPLFDKGKNLYGLFEARAAIKDAGRILVVEGYMDVATLAQFGIGYAVASLGTSTTAEHIKLLMRYSDDIYFCFDGDEAGRKAAWRALENALPQLKDDKSLYFLFLPNQHDPDSYVREYGKARFEEMLLQQSKPLSSHFFDKLTEHLNLNSSEGKAELVKTATPLLNQIQAPTLAFLLRQQLSEQTGIDPANLAHLMGRAAPKRHVVAKNYKLPQESFRQPETPTLVQKQIRTLLLNPQWANYAVIPDYLPIHGDFACLMALADVYQKHNNLHAAQAIEYFRDTPFAPTIEFLFRHTLSDNDELLDNSEEKCLEFQEGMQRLILSLKQEQIQSLRPLALQGDEQAKQLLLKLLMLK